jgi:hypothetical protein
VFVAAREILVVFALRAFVADLIFVLPITVLVDAFRAVVFL